MLHKFVRGRGLTQKLPRPLAHLVQNTYQALIRGRALRILRLRTSRPFVGRKVIVAGLFSHHTGLARAAELVSLQLESQGSKVIRLDIGPQINRPSGHEHAEQLFRAIDHEFIDATDLIIALNPDFNAVQVFESEFLKRVSVNAHWIWEIEKTPAFWSRRTVSFDRIFAPTEWVVEAFKINFVDVDIQMLPYGVDLDPSPKPSSEQRRVVRDNIGIAPDDFVVGYSFAALSNYYRKNPETLVRAFQLAFPNAPDVRLLLRSHDLHHRPKEQQILQSTFEQDRRILLFTNDNRIALDDFYAAIDTYASPSRAEGYGLNLIEASQAGIPVISNEWRLPAEIKNRANVTTVRSHVIDVEDPQGHYNRIKGARWSQPDVNDMAEKLKAAARSRSADPRI